MLRSALLATLFVGLSVAASKCDSNNKCPQDSPCCSQYGECGVGAFCLGGCDPRASFSLEACVPAPVCRSSSIQFTDNSSTISIDDYLGDASKATWVYQGEPAYMDGNVLLTMPKESAGTVMASTSYMWYGNVKAKFKTSRGQGVVTAFILLSDMKDEIDYEFVGSDLEQAQTNYYFQGITDYHNSGNNSLSDTFHNFHEYEIRWTPDKIEWLIDGQVGRTKERKDTWNETSQNWQFPQTPARVQLSIWPGGKASNAPGTINWAGGVIDWNSEDIKNVGYYYATFAEVSIECYNATSPPGTNKNKSYTYNSLRGTNDTVVDGNNSTVLGSLQGSGLNMELGASASQSGGAKSTQATIPGGSNGATGQDHSGSDQGNGGSSGGSGSGGSSGGANPGNCNSKTFNQNCNGGSGSGSGSGNGKSSGSKASASALAMVIAGCALFCL